MGWRGVVEGSVAQLPLLGAGGGRFARGCTALRLSATFFEGLDLLPLAPKGSDDVAQALERTLPRKDGGRICKLLPRGPQLFEVLGVVGVPPAPVREEVEHRFAAFSVLVLLLLPPLHDGRARAAAVADLDKAVALEHLVELNLRKAVAADERVVAADAAGTALLERGVERPPACPRDHRVAFDRHHAGKLQRNVLVVVRGAGPHHLALLPSPFASENAPPGVRGKSFVGDYYIQILKRRY